MQFSENVTTVTRTHVVPELFNTINVSSPLAYLTLSQATEWVSGTAYEVPIKYAKSTDGGTTGIADQLDSSRQDNKTKMSFQPRSMYKPVVIADIEMELNKGEERVLDLVISETHSQAADLMEVFSEELFSGTGTGNSWSSISMAADDSTNYATYGSLARATYSSLNGYYLASTGSLTLGKLATAFDATERGTSSPTELYTTRSLWSVYETLLTPTVRANYTSLGYSKMTPDGLVAGGRALSGTQGFDAVTYRGKPVMKDDKCPSGNLFLVNSAMNGMLRGFQYVAIKRTGEGFSTVNFGLPEGTPKGVFGSRRAPMGFSFRDMMSPVDQLAKVGYLMFDGEFLSPTPDLQGRLVGVTA